MLRLQNISYELGMIGILHQVSLEIPQGSFFSILGPSGCGKSTLLRIISGLSAPDSGDVFLDGHPITNTAAQKRPINVVFQNYALFPHLSVYENVAFGPRLKGWPPEEIKRAVHETLSMVMMSDFSDRRIDQLSGGQQQRIALARAIINKPKILLLDEPLSALDLKLRELMRLELLKLQRKLGITFILVTHDQEEAMALSDQIAVMNEGRILQVGSPQRIYQNPKDKFVATFVGSTNLIQYKNQTYSVRPESIHIYTESTSSENIRCTVKQILFKGAAIDLVLEPLRDAKEFEFESNLIAQCPTDKAQPFQIGQTVFASLKIPESPL